MIRRLFPWTWALWCCLYSAFLRWTIWEAEHHLRECAADGLIDSLSLREFRGQIAAARVRLALLQGDAT